MLLMFEHIFINLLDYKINAYCVHPADESSDFLHFMFLIFLYTVLAADLIHVFSAVPRHLNFIDHTSDLGWKEYVLSENISNLTVHWFMVSLIYCCRSQRVQPIIVDAGIYLAGRNQFFQATEKRATPDGFKFFTGIVSYLACHFSSIFY